MIKHLRLLAVCVVLVSCGGQDKSPHGIENDFFYVRIFDGYFPLPNRYTVIPTNSSTSMARLSSSPVSPGVTLNAALENNSYVGKVIIGNVTDCKMCKDRVEAVDFLGSYMKIALKDDLIALKSLNEEETNAIFFDDMHYLYITDDAPELYGQIVARIRGNDGVSAQEEILEASVKE